jgi:aminoglycoside phosphotransferase (APT) family kinase protein
VAASIHSVNLNTIESVVEGFATRRDHAEACLAVFEGLAMDDPVLKDARAWTSEHLPPPSPAVLIHGDLLGQNILLSLEDEPVGVIDWEFATAGDPAYDLAIVTRGTRRPFQLVDGFERLVAAYAEAGGVEISASDVSFHEVCLAVGWYRDSLDTGKRVHPPDQELVRLKGILGRAINRS